MLIRQQPDARILISQPAHSWVSGQLARAWGNATFGDFEPREEVCLASEQHDIGFLPWETAPTFNARTGLPHDFMDMPTDVHLAIWDRSVQHAMIYSRYAALLVSRHVSGLGRRHLQSASRDEARAVEAFLDRQSAWQNETTRQFQGEPAYARAVTPEILECHQKLISAWDWMSLLLLMGFSDRRSVGDVPSWESSLDLTLQSNPEMNRVRVAPWPFGSEEIELVCDGKRGDRAFANEEELRRVWATTEIATVRIVLIPG